MQIKNSAISKWQEAIDFRSLDLVREVYSETAILMATFAKSEKIGINEIVPYFINLFKKDNLSVIFTSYETQTIEQIKGSPIEILSGTYIFSYSGLLNVTRYVPARYTFVTIKDKNEFKIINHHSSLRP